MIVINGEVVFEGDISGKSVVVTNNNVVINGQTVYDKVVPSIYIEITGNVNSVQSTSGDITVTGNVGSIKTTSGDIEIDGDIQKQCSKNYIW